MSRITRGFVLAAIAASVIAGAGAAPAHATHCYDHRPGAPTSVTSAHTSGGIEVRSTYNYSVCRAYAALSNYSNGSLSSIDLKLWRITGSGCPSGGSNGLKLAEWAGTLGANTIKTISASAMAGACFRVTVWLLGWPWDGEQVFARRY